MSRPTQAMQLREREYNELHRLLNEYFAPWDTERKKRCEELARKFGLRIEWKRVELQSFLENIE